jgi:hypothetical protein
MAEKTETAATINNRRAPNHRRYARFARVTKKPALRGLQSRPNGR